MNSAGGTGKHRLIDNGVEVNLDLVYDVAANDEEYVALMVKTFLNTMPATMEKIVRYANEQDWPNLFSSAHFAKSSYSIVVVSNMLEIIKQIEVSAKTQTNLEGVPYLVATATSMYEHAEKMLTTHFTGTGAKAAE
jgi:HPt (histidine-containing phosphotransfer) domain-containing protein